jgi:hypothetical protein
MAQIPIPRCDCCGLPIDSAGNDYCSRCQYPINPVKEKRFLEESIQHLKQVAMYGGAYITVADLIRRYEARLHYLHSLKDASMAASRQEIGKQDTSEKRHSGETSILSPVPQPVAPILSLHELPEDSIPSQEPIPQLAVTPAQASARISFLSALSSDALVNIVASLGGFFVLVGALGFITTTANLLLAFLVVFFVHTVFGVTGLITHRFPSFRIVSGTYTIIFALLVPLVGFSAYRLVANNLVELSVPTLVALAALYAAVTYTMLALVQRFVPFAYLGLLALLVADLALARAFQWGYWWWPVAAMILAFPALIAIHPSGNIQPFAGSRAILQTPTRVLMYGVVTACWISGLVILAYSLSDDMLNMPQPEIRFALFILALLLSGWTALLIWQTRNEEHTPLLAYLLPMCVLAGAYALNLEAIGYALALTGIALFYVGLNRTAGRLLTRLAPLSLRLDQIALVIAILVPFISSPLLPLQLLARAFAAGTSPVMDASSFLHFAASWQAVGELAAVALCFAITLEITFRRAGLSKTPAQIDWCWLLVSAGFLLVWEYSLIVLLLNFVPVWAFVGLTLALIAVAVVIRRLIGAAWAKPLDLVAVVTLGTMVILSLNQNPDTICALLSGFAAILYGILLYQRRSAPLFLPFSLALFALPLLATHHPPIMLLLGLLLPLATVPIHRLVARPEYLQTSQSSNKQQTTGNFEWPPLVIGLLSGIISLTHDLSTNTSTIEAVTGHHFPIALQIALLGLAWYGAAVLVSKKLWLFPSAGFAAIALLIPTNDFWVLTGITPGLSLLGLGVSRIADRKWAWPFYSAALLSACMSGYAGIAQEHVAATGWILLGFAVLAYGIGTSERLPYVLWLTPVLATWAVIDAISLQGDLYRAPIVALVSVGLGIGVRMVARKVKTSWTGYALPFYATAFTSMLLTGIYGTVTSINHPFYGAVPDALLVYAVVAFAVAAFEQQPQGNGLAALFAAWGTILAVQLTASYMLVIGIGAAVAGLLIGRLVRVKLATTQENAATGTVPLLHGFTWNWPWYGTALLAAVLLGFWPSLAANQPFAAFIPYSLLAFTVVAAVVALVEQTPELMLMPIAFAAWTIWLWLPPLTLVQSMIAYSLLCLLIFASQFAWLLVPPKPGRLSARTLCNGLALGGQSFVVLAIIGQGGLALDAGTLVHVGAGALLELALLLFLCGIIHFSAIHHRNAARSMAGDAYEQVREARMQRAQLVLHWCNYGAGLLFSLVVSWELIALHQTRFDVLTLAPASYLIVIAPFLMHDQVLPERHIGGQVAALAGAALLLLPALWFSFSDTNLLPTLILVGESLLLLLLGMMTRLRIFILSSAALVVIGTLRILFLSIPPSLPLLLMAFGTVLVIVATGLIRARRRLRVAWTRWE